MRSTRNHRWCQWSVPKTFIGSSGCAARPRRTRMMPADGWRPPISPTSAKACAASRIRWRARCVTEIVRAYRALEPRKPDTICLYASTVAQSVPADADQEVRCSPMCRSPFVDFLAAPPRDHEAGSQNDAISEINRRQARRGFKPCEAGRRDTRAERVGSSCG